MAELTKGDWAKVQKTAYYYSQWTATPTIERASEQEEFMVKGEFVQISRCSISSEGSYSVIYHQTVYEEIDSSGKVCVYNRKNMSSSLIPETWLVPLRFKPGDEVVVTKTAWYNDKLAEWVEENAEEQPEFVIAGQVVKIHKYELDGWKGKTGRVTLLIPVSQRPVNKLPSGIPEDWLEEPGNFYPPRDRIQIVLQDLYQNLFMADQP